MQLLNYFWNQLNFDDIPSLSQLRIKELLLIINSINYDSHEVNRSSVITKESEVREWASELINLVGLEQSNNLAGNLLIQQAKALINGEQNNTFLDSEASLKILNLIEQYQKSSNPLQWTNFGSQIYLEINLSRKIQLLYQIGEVADIVSSNETFDSYTRVTKVTQSVCDRVCSWVENSLKLNMDYINVYEPFIEEYKRRIYDRSKILKEIGTRSGILPAEFLDNNQKISRLNAKLVIDWISTSLKIELAFPEESELESELNDKVPEKECELESKLNDKAPGKECELELELNDKAPEKECELGSKLNDKTSKQKCELEPVPTNKVPHNWFYPLIGVVSFLILIAIPLSPMFVQLYRQLVEQPALTPDKPLLKMFPPAKRLFYPESVSHKIIETI